MTIWLDLLGITLVILGGLLVGSYFSKLRGHRWLIGYGLSIFFIFMLLVPRFNYRMEFVFPFSLFMFGRFRFVTLALATTIGLMAPYSRIKYRFQKWTVALIMALVLSWFIIGPFLVPGLIRGNLLQLETNIDANGDCFQGTNFTCAPAAAVTALNKLGLNGHEGELAALSYCCPMTGTIPQCLADTLQRLYIMDGLVCRYESYDSVADLRQNDITLVILKESLLKDHCVAILAVRKHTVVLADPVTGREEISIGQFQQRWRYSGISMKRYRPTASKIASQTAPTVF